MSKREMIPVFARGQDVSNKAEALKRAVYDLTSACQDCDGSFDTVDAVRYAADAVRHAGAECSEYADEIARCAHRSCDRVT